MSPYKVDRANLKQLTDLPNVGKATANDLRLLGFNKPAQLADACPFEMYERLCRITGCRHDPCVIDVFMSITDFINGNPPRPWWDFTECRKNALRVAVTVPTTN
ncbi:MAG: helix-hairpin-helix domain-containing protein [Rhodocyclaceae bacterium]|nr:helix-hairpin-helix domain-containing protein [Rhodocyclaceae bacterium]